MQTGLVTGDGDKLLPQRLLTRAEATVLLERMLIQVGLIDG
ncbi:S-layer homology domain-containing protein [Paenibacillus sp. 79R4]